MNSLLVLLSLFVLFLALEFVVFRFILVASDFPKLQFANGILKYQSEQEGIYRVRNEIKSRFKINKDGWNSKYQRYVFEKPSDLFRIAIIGDSMVEALQVNYDQSLAEQLEEIIGPDNTEVYRFAISGAHICQYLHMLRQEVLKYSPDLVVIVLVHNDFDESYSLAPGVYTKSFLRLDMGDDRVLKEVPPVQYRAPWYSFLRRSATWRYLVYRRQVHFGRLRNIIFRNIESGSEKEGHKKQQAAVSNREVENEKYQANIDVRNLDMRMAQNELAAKYVFKKIKEACLRKGVALLLLMDGVRDRIYSNSNGTPGDEKGALRLNAMVRSVASEYQIDFIDLHPVFKSDFRVNRQKLEFESDGHWNRYSHRVVAKTIADFIKK